MLCKPLVTHHKIQRVGDRDLPRKGDGLVTPEDITNERGGSRKH